MSCSSEVTIEPIAVLVADLPSHAVGRALGGGPHAVESARASPARRRCAQRSQRSGRAARSRARWPSRARRRRPRRSPRDPGWTASTWLARRTTVTASATSASTAATTSATDGSGPGSNSRSTRLRDSTRDRIGLKRLKGGRETGGRDPRCDDARAPRTGRSDRCSARSSGSPDHSSSGHNGPVSSYRRVRSRSHRTFYRQMSDPG